MTAAELRWKFQQDLEKLQKQCPHLESDWIEHYYAPGHYVGMVKVCKNCEVLIDTNLLSESPNWEPREK